MKKIIALFLATVMCLALAACGNNDEMAKYKKYDTLINYMEAEDYEGVAQEIIRISQESSSSCGAADDNGNTENNVKSETVELTLDNWKDFFELRLKPEYRLNEFGEVETLVLSQFLVFKEEYAGCVTCNDVAIEMNKTVQVIEIKLDSTEQSYTLGEVVEQGELVNIESMNDGPSGYYIDIFSNNYINATENANPGNNYNKTVILVDSMDDLEAIRIKGTITINK